MDGGTPSRPPRLLLLSGASGVGKSTTAVSVASNLGIFRVVSTDMIREVLRSQMSSREHAALFRSSFSVGESTDAVSDWIDTCAAVEKGVEAVLNRARSEGCDIIVEGAHIIPANRLLAEWRAAGGIAVGVTLTIHDEKTHRERIRMRDKDTHRGAARYLASFQRIRAIQADQVTRAKGAGWRLADSHLHDDVPERIARWLNEEWYGSR